MIYFDNILGIEKEDIEVAFSRKSPSGNTSINIKKLRTYKITPSRNQSFEKSDTSKIIKVGEMEMFKTHNNFYKKDKLSSNPVLTTNKNSIYALSANKLNTPDSKDKGSQRFNEDIFKKPLTNQQVIEVMRASGVYRRRSMIKRLTNYGTKMMAVGLHLNANAHKSDNQLGYKKDQIFAQKEIRQNILSNTEESKKSSRVSDQNWGFNSSQNTKPSTGYQKTRNFERFLKQKSLNSYSKNIDNLYYNTTSTFAGLSQSRTQLSRNGSASPKKQPLSNLINDSGELNPKEVAEGNIILSLFQVNPLEQLNIHSKEDLYENIKCCTKKSLMMNDLKYNCQLNINNISLLPFDNLKGRVRNKEDELSEYIEQNKMSLYYYSLDEEFYKNRIKDKFDIYIEKSNRHLIQNEIDEAYSYIEKGIRTYGITSPYLVNYSLLTFLKGDTDEALRVQKMLFKYFKACPYVVQNLIMYISTLDTCSNIEIYSDQIGISFDDPSLLTIVHMVKRKLNTKNYFSFIGQTSQNMQQSKRIIPSQNSKIIQYDQSSSETLDFSKFEFTPQKMENKYIFPPQILNRSQASSVSPKKPKEIYSSKIKKLRLQQLKEREQLSKVKADEFYKQVDQKMQQENQKVKNFYPNIETLIKNEEEPDQPNDASKLGYYIAPNRKTCLDEVYKKLSYLQKTFVYNSIDPVDEIVTQLIEDLTKLSNAIDLKKFIEDEQKIAQIKKESPDRPWKVKRKSLQQENIKKNQAMVRAQDFIRTMIKDKKSYQVVYEVQSLIEEAKAQKQTEKKNWNQLQEEFEINDLIQKIKKDNSEMDNNSSFDQHFDPTLDIDEAIIDQLEQFKTSTTLSEDDKLLKILAISKDEFERRRNIYDQSQKDQIHQPFITSSEKKHFELETAQFLDYIYDDFLVQSAAVPGTEIPSLFKDSEHMVTIRKYLDKLTFNLTSTKGLFYQLRQPRNEEIDWESPLNCNKNKIDSSVLKQNNQIQMKQTPKAAIALYFLQRINAMGFLNKIVKENLAKIKARREQGLQFFGQVGTDLSKDSLNYLNEYFNKNQRMKLLDYTMIDGLLSDLKFFSQFEKEIRIKIYKLCKFFHCQKKGEILVDSIRKQKYIYVILAGAVSIHKYDYELELEHQISMLRAGESFGDLSIQAKNSVLDAFLESGKISAQIDSQELYYFKFERKDFCNQLFREIKQDINQKIMTMKRVDFFEQLSPYAFYILAQNVAVEEFKLGDVIIKQGTIPKYCYIILEGCCKSVFDQVLEKKNKRNKSRQGDNEKKLMFGQTDYQQLAQLGKTQAQEQLQKDINKKSIQRKRQSQDRAQQAGRQLSFHNQILQDKSNLDHLEYHEHLEFNKIKEGDFFASRALIDNQVLKRHIVEELQKYKEKLGLIYEGDPIDEFFNQQQKQCYDYVQRWESKDTCGEQIFDINSQANISSFVAQEGVIDQEKVFQGSDIQANTNNLGLSHINDDMLLSVESLQDDDWVTEYQKHHSKQVQDIQERLMKSQVSIIADTSVVKVMRVNQEDKNFLNENLKKIINKYLLDYQFKDFDRPKMVMKEVLQEVMMNKNWIKYKQKLEEDIHRESTMMKYYKTS